MLIISELARNDIKEIWNFFADSDIEAANRVIKLISGKFQLLETNPQIGRERSNFLVNLRSFPIKNYVIFYFPIPDGVEIYRVFHASRDVDEIFDNYFDGLKE